MGNLWVPSQVPTAAQMNTLASGQYRKTTSKQVVNSVAETDLLNGEVTVAANALGSTGVLRVTAQGDYVNNSGAAQTSPRLKLKLGGTTLFDTGTLPGTPWSTSASRMGWRVQAEIANLGATNSQWAAFTADLAGFFGVAAGNVFTTGKGQLASIGNNAWARAIATTSSAVDTTAACALALTVINPAANASLDVTLTHALVEII